jgi:hypothetical protein
MTFLNTNMTYKRHYRPWLSLIRIGYVKDRIDHDVLNTCRTYKRPNWPWLSLVQVGHIKDYIDHDRP